MLIDTSAPSYGKKITDWQLGDDRQFVRAGLTGFVQGDSASSAYLTIKKAPTQADALAIAQKLITTSPTPAGVISNAGQDLLFNVYSGDIELAVSAGPTYYYDMRVLTAQSHTWSIETGIIEFAQNVTQTNIDGTPATLPNLGQPVFRGFTSTNPQFSVMPLTLFNQGDWFMNSQPASNQPIGWQCVLGGIPGLWQVIVPILASGGFFPPAPWSFGPAPPATGSHVQGEIMWNTLPTAGMGVQPNIGWVCVQNGVPGVWKEFGAIGV